MTYFSGDQILASGLLGVALVLFAWGRWRYDIVAVLALVTAVVSGLVPAQEAFSGFAHPAVFTVAVVLVISNALRSSGMLDSLIRLITPWLGNVNLHVLLLTLVTAVASAFMNNVAALSLMLPVAQSTAETHGRSVSVLLMPLAFGSLLGGMTTLIGTPPNLIVSAYRADLASEHFGLFAFLPVGGVVAVVGVVFIGLLGWRLLPIRMPAAAHGSRSWLRRYYVGATMSESAARTGADSPSSASALPADIAIVSPRSADEGDDASTAHFRPGEHLTLLAEPRALRRLLDSGSLELPVEGGGGSAFVEAVIAPGSPLVGERPSRLQERFAGEPVFVGLSRDSRSRRGETRLRVGDVLLLGTSSGDADVNLRAQGVVVLGAQRARTPAWRLIAALAAFACALTLVAFNLLALPIALLAAVLVFVALRVLPLSQLYRGVEWPVVVLLAAFIPVGEALHRTGVTELLASSLVASADALPPFALLATVMIVTMVLTEVLNNATTALVMSPVAVATAEALGANPDPFLIVVALGASCAFMTPVGHQSNTLVLEPGGYRFTDYARLGLPLQLLVIVIALPMVAMVWPLFG